MLVFQGNHRTIGQKIGEAYRDAGTRIGAVDIDTRTFTKQLSVYEKHYPQKIAQLVAIAETAGFDIDQFLYQNLCLFIAWHRRIIEPMKGCTIFGVKNHTSLYVGRNYDWRRGAERAVQIFESKNTDAYRYIGITDMDYASFADKETHHLFYSIDDAINSRGLYIGLTFAYHHGFNYGLSPIHMNQLVAETCQSVAEALACFERVPLGVPKNFFLADRHGDMVAIEHTSRTFKTIAPLNDILVHTNHFQNPELAREDLALSRNPGTSTFRRYAAALHQLTEHKETLSQVTVAKLLRDPAGEVYENHPHDKTIWSLSMDMKHQNYVVYHMNSGKLTKDTLTFS